MTDTPDFDIANYAKKYIKVDDARRALMKAQEIELKKYDDALDRMRVRLQGWLNRNNLKSAPTVEGTIISSERSTAQVGDWSAFHQWIVDNGRPDMLQRRVTMQAVSEYKEEHGAPPPGVSINVERVISVRRPTVKG